MGLYTSSLKHALKYLFTPEEQRFLGEQLKSLFRDLGLTYIKLGQILSKTKSYIRVEGHTDNLPTHNDQFNSNWQLSSVRAANVAELLITNTGIDPSKVVAVGCGEYRPVASNQTAEGRAKNRRVEIIVVNDKYNQVEKK
jgi:chemotaxis protein MotB